MKKYILSIIAVITLIAAPALAGVWTAQSSSGGSGSDSAKGCYLVIFPTATYGTQQLMGNGVVSGNTFSGFLRAVPIVSNSGFRYCGTGGDCVWIYIGSYGVISVYGLPINSAQAIACW